MKLVIAGSRSFGRKPSDHRQAELALEKYIKDVTVVVSGGAIGADLFGEWWAESVAKCPVKRFIPDWKAHGRAAGIIRNGEMAAYADRAIVFWDGASKGAKNMIDDMKYLGKPVEVVMIHWIPAEAE